MASVYRIHFEKEKRETVAYRIYFEKEGYYDLDGIIEELGRRFAKVGVASPSLPAARVEVSEIDIDEAIGIAERDWGEIRAMLEARLRGKGFLRADAAARALMEEAKAQASAIVREALGEGHPELEEKVAKYIIALMLAERPARGAS